MEFNLQFMVSIYLNLESINQAGPFDTKSFQSIPNNSYSNSADLDQELILSSFFTLSSNYVTINTFTGLKILISLFCFGASFYQSFVLFDNFKSKDTLRKNTEVTYPDNYTTPMIIVCSDPGNQKPEDPLIELNNEADLSGLIPPVRVFRTMYKVRSCKGN